MDIVDVYMVLMVFAQACAAVAGGIGIASVCLGFAGKIDHFRKMINVAFVMMAVAFVSLLLAPTVVYLSRLSEN